MDYSLINCSLDNEGTPILQIGDDEFYLNDINNLDTNYNEKFVSKILDLVNKIKDLSSNIIKKRIEIDKKCYKFDSITTLEQSINYSIIKLNSLFSSKNDFHLELDNLYKLIITSQSSSEILYNYILGYKKLDNNIMQSLIILLKSFDELSKETYYLFKSYIDLNYLYDNVYKTHYDLKFLRDNFPKKIN